MTWFLIGLAAARLLALLWEQIPGRVNMRWRASFAAAEPASLAESVSGPGSPSTTP